MFKLLLVCCIAAAALVVVYLAARAAYQILQVKLDAYLPVCWDCHIAGSFRREHADLVTDRDSKAAARVPRASTPVG
jgi:hypothetical protein